MYVQFAELPVHDQARAKRFYVDNLGCEVAADAPMGSDGWRWIELRFTGSETTLHFVRARKKLLQTRPFWCWSLTTWPVRSKV